MAASTSPSFPLPAAGRSDFRPAKIRAFQWDLARQVERFDWLLAQLPRYAQWGYQELYLHLEDAIEYPSLPEVARADAYSHRQVRQLVAAATDVGIRVVPIVNLLGHTQYLIKTPGLRDLNELRAEDGSPLAHGQLCPLHPRTLEVADKLIRDVTPFCTAGKVHLGLDESFQLGRCPRCRAEIKTQGRAAHFAGHVRRLHAIAAAQGLGSGMWADMLYFLPAAISLLPADIAMYEWYYYRFGRRPRVELFNFATSDVGERLRARGLEYWGCPMNGAFRHEPLPHFGDRLDNIISWWRHCQRMNATGFLVTSWEPNRLAMELTTVIDAAAASLWLDPGIASTAAMLEQGFARVSGKRNARESARIALACDRHPFGGYPRWQVNTRWDVVSRRESLAPYQAEERHFRRLRAQAQRVGAPLRASVEFRHYLAERDVMVRQIARGRSPHIPAFSAAQRAAEACWRSTRDAKVEGPGAAMVRADAVRFEAWQSGAAASGPPWQLCYRVSNFAPAAQLVAVEQQGPDGKWAPRQACHTIEFQARAARPRGGITREHAAPIDWNGNPDQPPRLRFVLRGLGQVKLTRVCLTDGRSPVRVPLPTAVLGRPAPQRGFPRLDWSRRQAVMPIVLPVGGRR